jgi:hypothetical protein
MNTDKLIKAIQILVKEELKTILPALVKEAVKAETTKLLKENKELKKHLVAQKQPSTPTFMDMDVNEGIKQPKTYTKNAVINDILNQTKPFSQSGMNESVLDRTVSFNTQNVPMGGGMAPNLRAQMAAKMGYSDFSSGPQVGGLGVQTGNDSLDKALNRDYSELVKRFKK